MWISNKKENDPDIICPDADFMSCIDTLKLLIT